MATPAERPRLRLVWVPGLVPVPLLALLVLLALPACAQRRPVLKSGLETEGAAVRAVFAPVVAAARRSTVRLSPAAGGDAVALGLVVSARGEVLTKASELRDQGGTRRTVVAHLADGRRVAVRVVAADARSDLALLRMEPAVENLVALDPAAAAADPTPVPATGSWVAVPGTDAAPDAVGVVSAGARELSPVRLGVGFFRAPGTDDEPGPLVVSFVQDDMGAAQAGVRRGDRMLRLDGRDLVETRDLIEPLRDANVGDTVDLVVERDGQRLTLPITLMHRPLNLKDRTDFMNQMGNTLSRRRDGFDAVFQHDATIEPEQCGGPLVDLDGRLIGINIARAGRVESYALPLSEVAAALARLRAAAPTP